VAQTCQASDCGPIVDNDHLLLALSSRRSKQLSMPSDFEPPRSGAGGRAQQLLELVQSLAVRATNQTGDVSEVDVALLDGIQREMEQVLNSTNLDHVQSQHAIDRARDDILACTTLAGSVTEAAPSLGAKKGKEHAACRALEAELSRNKTASCEGHAAVLKAPNMPDCVSYLQQPEDPKYDPTNMCLTAVSTWLSDYNSSLQTSRAVCQAATSAHSIRMEQCGKDQVVFETSFCDEYHDLVEACTRFNQCYASKLAERDAVHEDSVIPESGRKSAYAAASKIDCYLKVLAAEHVQRPNLLAECQRLQANTTHLDLVYHPAPEKLQCNDSIPSSTPCDRAWLTEQYENEFWYTDAPTGVCTPCETAEPEPTSEPAPVHCSADHGATSACCGQSGDPFAAARRSSYPNGVRNCPSHLPECHDYVNGRRMGTCREA